MDIYHSFESLGLDDGGITALDATSLISMPNLVDFSWTDEETFENPTMEQSMIWTESMGDHVPIVLQQEVFQNAETNLHEENYSQEQWQPNNIGEDPTEETDALYQCPHQSILQQQVLMQPTDKAGQINVNVANNQISYGSTVVEEYPTNEKKSTKLVKSVDASSTITFAECSQLLVTFDEASMAVSVPPCPYQRARYEGECSGANRYIFVPWNQIFTITIPDLRLVLAANFTVQLRITRTTVQHGTSGLTSLHPYPIWINNDDAKAHNGSLFVPVTEQNMKNGYLHINNLALLRLKQPDLAKITALAVYSPTQLSFSDLHSTGMNGGKKIRDEYDLQRSMLVFQLFLVDEHNMAYCTDVICKTDIIQEYEAKEMSKLRPILDSYGAPQRSRSPMKHKRIGRQKKSRGTSSKKSRGVAKRYDHSFFVEMNQHQKINDLIETGRVRKKRRLHLQRTSYKYRIGLAKKDVERLTEAADHCLTEEENIEFECNESIITSHSNANRLNTAITTHDDQYSSSQNLHDASNIEEQILTSNRHSSNSSIDNSETDESFNIEIEDDDNNGKEDDSESIQNPTIVLHRSTNVLLDDACFDFLQLIRRSQISKTNANRWLLFIKSLLPFPNSIPSNINGLLTHLNIFNYFQKRTVCLLCRRNLQDNQTKCDDCSIADKTNIAYVLDTDVLSLLKTTVSRLANEIQKYKDYFLHFSQNEAYDIPFAKRYKNLVVQYPGENLLSLILHIDGISLVKSTKLKLWLCSASIVELPPNLRVRRKNIILLSMYIGYTEPDIILWLQSNLQINTPTTPFRLILYGIIGDCPAMKLILNMVGHTGYYCCFYCFIKGIHSKEARKRQYPYSSQTQQRTTNSFITNGKLAEENNSNVFGHLGNSILQGIIDVPLPFSILIDYAHVTLLRHFRGVIQKISSSLAPSVRQQIDVNLRSQAFPHIFNRKLRGIEELSFIKAVELKNLLLYAFIPNFIDHLTTNQIGFLSLLVLGIRLIHADKIFGDNTSLLAHELLTTYYRDNTQYFHNHVNFVLHLHEHLASLYDQHGPLSSINTLAFEDFIGYVSKNRNGTVFQHDLLAYYFNIDVHLRNSMQEKHLTSDGLFDLFVLSSKDSSFNALVNYHAKKCLCNVMINCVKYYRRCIITNSMAYFDNNTSTRKHRSTQNKIPARYILTPTPPSRRNQNPNNENIDPYSRKFTTQNGEQSNKKVKFRSDLSLSSNKRIRIASEDPESQHCTQEQFGTYRRRSRSRAKSSNKKCSLFASNVTSNSNILDVDDERHVEIISESEHDDFDDNDEHDDDGDEEEHIQHMLNEERNEEVENDNDDGNYHVNQPRQVPNDANISKKKTYRTNEHQTKNFQFEFGQLRTDLADAISKLVNRVETHQDKIEKQFKNLSKKINQTTVDSSLEMYRRDGETFSRTPSKILD
ncbi:unnamed protein product [Rotaria socialis]